MKKGQKIKMYFYFAGVTSEEKVKVVTSEEKVKVIDFDESTITIQNTWHPDSGGEEQHGRFERKTGTCLNDNTYFNCKRFIDPQ